MPRRTELLGARKLVAIAMLSPDYFKLPLEERLELLRRLIGRFVK